MWVRFRAELARDLSRVTSVPGVLERSAGLIEDQLREGSDHSGCEVQHGVSVGHEKVVPFSLSLESVRTIVVGPPIDLSDHSLAAEAHVWVDSPVTDVHRWVAFPISESRAKIKLVQFHLWNGPRVTGGPRQALSATGCTMPTS